MPEPHSRFALPEAVYLPDGRGRYLTTPLAAGPWDPDGQHAGASAALLAHSMERHELDDADPATVLMARVTVDLLRPAPIAPVEVAVSTIRSGRRAQWVEATLAAGGRDVARATGLRLPAAPLDLPERTAAPLDAPPDPDTVADADRDDSPWLMFWHGMKFRPCKGERGVPGPGAAWFDLEAPLIAGVENTPLMRVVAAADFTLGISGVLDFERFTFPNADLTVHLHRYPEGPWVCVDAATEVNRRGSGLSEAVVWDRTGPLGRSAQSLVVGLRP